MPSEEEVQQARVWLHAHKPHTFEEMDVMDNEAKRLYKWHMDTIKAHLNAWMQARDSEGYAMLLTEVMRGIQ